MQGSVGQKRVTTYYLKTFKVAVSSDDQEQQLIASVLTTPDKNRIPATKTRLPETGKKGSYATTIHRQTVNQGGRR